VLGALGRGDDCEQGVRAQGPAPPCQPAADLALIEPCQALGGPKAFLNGPSPSGGSDQLTERDQGWAVAAVESEFAVAKVAADQQPVVSRLGGQCDQRSVVVALPPGTRAG